MPAKLYLRFPRSKLQYEVSSEKEVIAGRAETCDVDLGRYFEGYLKAVSRQHFKISYKKGEGFTIADISYNGTEVNDDSLAPGEHRILRDGDVITLARDKNLVIKVSIQSDPDVTDAIDEPSLFFQAAKTEARPGLYFDTATAQFVVDGKPIPHELLTKRDVALLTYLCGNAGRLCSFDDIAAHVWSDPAWSPSNNTISRAVGDLRRKLNQISPGAEDYIQNIRGQGYKVSRD